MVSPADWRDIWLNEGFASYAEALWFEAHGGRRGAIAPTWSTFRPSTSRAGPLYDPAHLFDPNTVYNKGAWVAAHAARRPRRRRFLRRPGDLPRRTAYRSTTTAEFQEIVEERGPADLDWFFRSWIYGVDRPTYDVSFLSIGSAVRPDVAIHLDSGAAGPDFFPMPVDLLDRPRGRGIGAARVFTRSRPRGLRDSRSRWRRSGSSSIPRLDPEVVEDGAYGLNITTTDLPGGSAGEAFAATLRGRGGEPPYVWTALDALPAGVDLDAELGEIHGTAPDSGLYAFRVSIHDRLDATDTQRSCGGASQRRRRPTR